jgi:hypothetical protein
VLARNRVRIRGFSELRKGLLCSAHSPRGRSALVRFSCTIAPTVAHVTVGTPCSPSQTRYVAVSTPLPGNSRSRQSSSFVGPLIVGLIADSTGNIRYAFFFLVVMIWLAVPVLLSVDVEQGRIDAQTYSVEQEAQRESVELTAEETI